MEFTKTRHVLEAMCEGAVMPVRDTPWEGWTLLALAGASEDLSTNCSSAPDYFCSIIFHPSSVVFRQLGFGQHSQARDGSLLMQSRLLAGGPDAASRGLWLRLVARLWV